MVGCAAFGCSNWSEKGTPMYGFPKDMDRRKIWLARVSRSDLNIKKNFNNRKLCAVSNTEATNLWMELYHIFIFIFL